jgi:hypothetical protein
MTHSRIEQRDHKVRDPLIYPIPPFHSRFNSRPRSSNRVRRPIRPSIPGCLLLDPIRNVSCCSASRLGNDRGGTRTLDQRINLPHRLSPTVAASHQVSGACITSPLDSSSRVGGLDYPIAIAGVPRLVSGAGARPRRVPCLLITQSIVFSNRHACRCRLRCGANGSRGRPSRLRHSLVAVRFLPARGSVSHFLSS